MVYSTRRQFIVSATTASAFVLAPGCTEASTVLVNDTIEKRVNPFGHPWESASPNDEFALASSSSFRLTRQLVDGNVNIEMNASYLRYMRTFTSPYHYDETIAKLADDMPFLRDVRAQLQSQNIQKKWLGYSAAYFAESKSMPGIQDMPEEYFLHMPGTEPTPENRLKYTDPSTELDSGGDLFNLQAPGIRTYLANSLTDAMKRNGVDALLVDYAVYDHAFGAELAPYMPQGYFDVLLESQFYLFEEISKAAKKNGLEIFLNGMTMNGIHDTTWAKIDLFASACQGYFWEQPFRTEWRDKEGKPDYFQKLVDFASIAKERDIKVIWKQGSHLMTKSHAGRTGWNWRFESTSEEKERGYADLFVSMFRILTAGEPNHILIYTHPVEALDIYSSEAYFKVLSERLGEPAGLPMLLAPDVIGRQFSSTFLIANFGDEPFLWNGREISPLSVHRSKRGLSENHTYKTLTARSPVN